MFILFRLVHAFTCAGVLPRQYIKFSKFAEFGVVGKWFIQQGQWKLLNVHVYVILVLYMHNLHSVYKERGYLSVVESLAEESMKKAVDEVMAKCGNGEVYEYVCMLCVKCMYSTVLLLGMFLRNITMSVAVGYYRCPS